MKLIRCVAALVFGLAFVIPAPADDKKDNGFVPMFNGKDLTGWVNVNCAPGTFYWKDGEVITTGKPTGFLRTAKQYENFIAEFEWMHVNKKEVGNSGFFVWADPLPGVGTPYTRGIEVQVLVNLEKEGHYTSQGDVFSIHGATCKPDRPHPQGWARCLPNENRCKGGGEWNRYKIVAKDGVIKLHVNGKEVSGVSECKPRKGYLALESEGAECHFRNLKIKELPSSNPKPEEIADVAKDFKNLFTGLDLSGWNADEDAKKHWQPRDWVLSYDGKGKPLSTANKFDDCEFIIDYRFPKPEGNKPVSCAFILRGEKHEIRASVQPHNTLNLTYPDGVVGRARLLSSAKFPGGWNRIVISLKNNEISAAIKGEQTAATVLKEPLGKVSFMIQSSGPMEFGNLFVR